MDTSIAAGASKEAVLALLRSNGLPTSDLQPGHFEHFLICGDPHAPDGVVGVEIHAQHGLLRSLAVMPGLRGRGHGRALVAAAEDHARKQGVRELYLLTNTAETFFARLGYEPASRPRAPQSIRASPEFASLCPDDCAFLCKRLDAEA